MIQLYIGHCEKAWGGHIIWVRGVKKDSRNEVTNGGGGGKNHREIMDEGKARSMRGKISLEEPWI